MTALDLDTTGLTASEVATLERYDSWLSEHPGRTTGISLMTAEDQAGMDWWVQEHCPDGLLLCEDGDASNCAGVYRAGPLRGMVFVLMHDDHTTAPRFASIHSLVDLLTTDRPEVRDFGMLSHSDPRLGDFPPTRLAPDLLTAARHVFASARWKDNDADEDTQFNAYRTALALVPPDHIPQHLLDDITQALLVSDNTYLWQAAPTLLSTHAPAYHAQISAILHSNRTNTRWTDIIAPIREALRGPAGG